MYRPQSLQVGFFKKNPKERSAAATAADADDVSQWAIYYFVYFLGYDSYNCILNSKTPHQKQPRWDKKSLRDVNCQILINKESVKYENYHEEYYFVQLYTTLPTLYTS